MTAVEGSAAVVERMASALSFLGERLQRDFPLAPLCTYRVGGPAELFVAVADPEELVAVAAALAALAAPSPADLGLVHVFGKGSNLLVADAGVPGLVLQLGDAFAELAVLRDDGEHVVVALGAALSLPVAARRIAALGLSGFEWAVGIPGSVGGAVRMNAGGHGSELVEVLRRVHLVDLATGEALVVEAAQLELAYRSSALRDHQVVTGIEIALVRGDVAQAEERLSEIVRWRRENQPGGANAGSVFTNPPGDSAGRLIDSAGCKELRIGSAQVSGKHANFIQVDPEGSADDVMALMKAVVARVREHHGVTLHAETVLLGFPQTDVEAVKGGRGGPNR